MTATATKTTATKISKELKNILPIARGISLIKYAVKARKEIIGNPRKIDDPALNWLDFLGWVVNAYYTGRLNPATQFFMEDTKGSKAIKILVETKLKNLEFDELVSYLNQNFFIVEAEEAEED